MVLDDVYLQLHFEVREPGSYKATARVSLQKVGYISQEFVQLDFSPIRVAHDESARFFFFCSDFNSLVGQERPTDTALTAQQILNLLLHNATPE